MLKFGGKCVEQAKRKKAREEAKEAEPDLSSSNSSSSEAKEGEPDLSSSNSSSNSSSSSCSSSCGSDCDLHNHNFDPVDDAADLLQQEECDYDSDNETSVELRGLVSDAEDEN
jgi:hypothetical protein